MELLLKLADVIDENAEELARLESQNVGKPWWVAVDEPGVMSDNLRFFAGAARNLEGKAAGEYVEGYTSMIRREPLGIVAGICPWNYPLYHGDLEDRAGARGRQRPDHQAGRADAAHDAPLRRARAGGPPAGRAPGGHRRRRPRRATRSSGTRTIRLVSLTGDTATGKIDREERRRTPSSASTSSSAARRRWSCSTTPTRRPSPRRSRSAATGTPARTAPRRRASSSASEIYDDVLSETVKARRGDEGRRPGRRTTTIDMGPVISAEQQERVLGFLERAVDAKATIVTGGESVGDRGFFVKPTIVTDVEQDAEIVQNEVFGPVVTMQRFASDDEAIAMANDVRYGLAASVFSRERRPGAEGRGRSSTSAPSGSTSTSSRSRPEMPHGGFKESGLRQGHVDLLDGGVHPHQARRGEARRVTQLGPTSALHREAGTERQLERAPRRRPDVRLENVVKRFDGTVAVDGISLEIPRGLVLRAARPVGLRQDDDAADDRRLRGADRGPRSSSATRTSSGCRRTSATSTRSSRATRSSRTCRSRTTSPSGSSARASRRTQMQGPRRRDARARRARRVREAQADAALRRPAAARRARRARSSTTRACSCSTSRSARST